MLWLLVATCVSAASLSTSPATTSSPSSTQSTRSKPTADSANFITIPLAVPENDGYYNAIVTDDTGNTMGVRVDMLQPDLWLMNGLAIADCLEVKSYLSAHTALASDDTVFEVSGTTYPATVCHLDGAFTPVDVTTTHGTTITTTASHATGTSFLVSYPNGIYADGVLQNANFSLGTTNNEKIILDDFEFVLANDTNMYAGGLGLTRNPRGQGVLDYLKKQGHILASGYSLFFSGFEDLNTTAGELLLGAVDQQYYKDSLYKFPTIPYEGWSSDGAGVPLPIVALEEIKLENTENSKLVTLSTGKAIPVLLDSRMSYSFLPLDVLVNLAIQTNAYYNSQNDRWIVRCLDIESSNATFHMKFGQLDVGIPLIDLMYDAYYGDNYLYFSNNDRACFLNVMPSTSLGYPSLGLPFLSHIYFAMDNEGGNVAMALANDGISIDPDSFLFSASASDYPSTLSAESISNTVNNTATVAYIESGYIPFATTASYSSNYTMTFFSTNSSNVGGIPTRFTMATILSGEVFVTKSSKISTTGSAASASAANAESLRSAGVINKPNTFSALQYVSQVLLLVGGTLLVALM